VVRLQLNDFELCDMHGNVYEWLHDYYGEDYYKQPPAQDPTGSASGTSRVLRGGSWNYGWSHCCSYSRSKMLEFSRYNYNGFRVVRELD